jgi:serine protease Do
MSSKVLRDIFVKLTNGKEYEAKVLGTDPTSDIAVIKINNQRYFKGSFLWRF